MPGRFNSVRKEALEEHALVQAHVTTVVWEHTGQVELVSAVCPAREQAEVLYALVLAHYGRKAHVSMWQGELLIKKHAVA